MLNINNKLLQNREFSDISFKTLRKKINKNIGYVDSYFSEEPFSYWSGNCKKLFEELSISPGIKARVPINDTSLMIDISKRFSFLCDLIVFSPAPLWPSCHTLLEEPWPEFNIGSFGRIGREISFSVNQDVSSLYAALIALGPFIKNDMAAYMPQIGHSLHRWDYEILGLSDLPSPYIEKGVKLEAIREEAAIQLYIDNVASNRMGCIHVLPSLMKGDLGIDNMAFDQDADKTHVSQMLMSIEIPYLLNASIYDISRIIMDEHESVVNFRKSVLAAIDSISKITNDPVAIKRAVLQIQKDIIEEPLIGLKTKLKRIASSTALKMSGYVVASGVLFFSSVLGSGIFTDIAKTVGSVSLLNVYSEYVNYLEKRAQLRNDSAFCLFKIEKQFKK